MKSLPLWIALAGLAAFGWGQEPEQPLPAPFQERRVRSGLDREGGTAETERAVEAALDWLVRHQAEDGRWAADDFAERCVEPPCRGPSNSVPDGGPGSEGPGAGDGHFDVGVTGLALLALMGHGETHRGASSEARREAVGRGIGWLLESQAEVGSIGVGEDVPAYTASVVCDGPPSPLAHGGLYNHAIATAALCEALAMTGDEDLRDAARAAVQLALAAQTPGGGWNYPEPGGSNSHLTGWMVLALTSARDAGIDIPPEAFQGAMTWFDRVAVPFDDRSDRGYARSGEIGYMAPGDGGSYIEPEEAFTALPTNTALALLCRDLCGDGRRDLDAAQAAILMQHLPRWEPRPEASPINLCYWLHATYALFCRGGEDWRRWNEALREALVPSQRRDACARGSWDPVSDWAMVGGRVYTTAVGALTLEVYYRYPRAR